MRLRRLLVGMSQEKLGDALGLTFQQVQKYEKGANRVSASRLYEIAKTLEVPINYFFEGFDDPDSPAMFGEGGGSSEVVYDLITSPEGGQLAAAFSEVRSPRLRRRVLEFVRFVHEMEEDAARE